MAENDELMREVNEAVRRERWERVWKKYGSKALSFVLILLTVAVGLVVWQEQQRGLKQERSDTLLAGMALYAQTREARLEGLSQLQELAVKKDSPQAQMAALTLAARYQMDGVGAMVIPQLQAVAAQNHNAILQSYACVLLKAQGEADCAVSAMFQPLANEFAAIKLAGAGEYQAARDILPVDGVDVMQSRRLDDLRAYLDASVPQDAATNAVE